MMIEAVKLMMEEYDNGISDGEAGDETRVFRERCRRGE